MTVKTFIIKIFFFMFIVFMFHSCDSPPALVPSKKLIYRSPYLPYKPFDSTLSYACIFSF